LIYVENFIRTGDYEKCIIADNKNKQYIKNRKFKFLCHPERNDLINVSRDSIVSVYKSDIEYYIISTETGEGIITDTALNKS